MKEYKQEHPTPVKEAEYKVDVIKTPPDNLMQIAPILEELKPKKAKK
jgi:hypothetical protein